MSATTPPTGSRDASERDVIPIRRALVSVSDKTGLLELAAALANAGVDIVSTGSTARQIAAAGHPVTEVSEVTGFPESLDGRVKTLHPAVHAGILADLRLPGHEAELAALGFAAFQLVVVNLYPFVETVASGAGPDAVIEQIDIGGPAMVRSAAKNHANVAVVVSPTSYAQVIKALTLGGTTLAQRQRLAGEAFAHTAAYDTAVAEYFTASVGIRADRERNQADDRGLTLAFEAGTALRYGENSHQSAILYPAADGRGIAQAQQLHGKEMSYNNYVDADAALRAAHDFSEPAVAIIKHANPCGIAVGPDIATAHRLAHECDPVSAFGGVIAANRTIDRAAAESIKDIFTEVLVAPDFTEDALEVLTAKKNLRLLRLPLDYSRETLEWRQVSGGLLVQTPDTHFAPFDEWRLVSGEPAHAVTSADLEFAWRAVRAVKSNAILLARDGASVGVGMGQVNRVDSCRLAVERAGDRARGSVAASDAFFPFADGLQVLLDAGVTAVVQPGGSVRDDEVIAAARDAGVTMYFTGERHFFH
ncbi:phosphoribosylaminoimidazolecarboxamide formyltransferase/IMP cyclohydrolase [Cryobacterium mesophilum]|uniref:Bifunctional purine biosynthesis protein PurH n=1 Tax=Terrimesophilobacter mesophilus TaxID=433647 RepID=A0A4R8V8Z9_9MICO|nr:bifunctional phosphoribosylaminoimidazolecarboxamide formyltransferase/IMP cyclohydrolase [Terrimesophilobacter mesophilus]MBB5632853.1 phosphoribosylaminoimidazolecarboxamide formyltransferase/IMP cyclohydrolase [Terrimesophilobacter mesophilus]TFB79631.1 bifunctional phosphoribosylaminoimidazolecarboxamide formyltransferase/IMP cyclohydrolase [Terrimesophilobacter mesophilus]